MELRYYQKDCINKILELLPKQQRILISAATGSGKTHMFNFIIAKLSKEYPSFRTAMIIDETKLVDQTKKRFDESYPELSDRTGTICSTLQREKDIGAQIVFSTIQSLYTELNKIGVLDFIVLDEAHVLPPAVENEVPNTGRYHKVLHVLNKVNPRLRVLGVTATPFRDHGYLYGKKCKAKNENYFPSLDYSIGMRELTEKGYLAPLKIMVSEKVVDLSKVKKTGSDYCQKELSDEMSKLAHIKSAVDVFKEFASETRRKTLVFAVTIEHAEKLAEAFRAENFDASATHSKISKSLREDILQDFQTSEETKIICSVSTLLKGVDLPEVDCILCARPTLSPVIHTQSLGRGVRKHPSKVDCLVLDISGNFEKHGHPEDPIITIPRRIQYERVEQEKTGRAMKICPGCEFENDAKAICCAFCGYLWQNTEKIKMIYVDWSLKGNMTEAEGFIDKIYLTEHHSFVSSNKSLRVNVIIGNEEVSNFYSFQPKVIGMFRAFWRKATGNKIYPETIEEAIKRSDEININYVIIKKRDKYWKISSFLRK